MVLAGAAHAAEDSSSRKDPTLEEARQHAANAKVHYDLGEFEKAAEEYILVYRLRPLPALLFNIGQTYRKTDELDIKQDALPAGMVPPPPPRPFPWARVAIAVGVLVVLFGGALLVMRRRSTI